MRESQWAGSDSGSGSGSDPDSGSGSGSDPDFGSDCDSPSHRQWSCSCSPADSETPACPAPRTQWPPPPGRCRLAPGWWWPGGSSGRCRSARRIEGRALISSISAQERGGDTVPQQSPCWKQDSISNLQNLISKFFLFFDLMDIPSTHQSFKFLRPWTCICVIILP